MKEEMKANRVERRGRRTVPSVKRKKDDALKTGDPTRSSRGSALTTAKGYERHHVKHDYHDYAHVMAVPSQMEIEMAGKAPGGVNNPFPIILHKLLSEIDELGFSDIISWQSHGRSFLIRKPQEFVEHAFE